MYVVLWVVWVHDKYWCESEVPIRRELHPKLFSVCCTCLLLVGVRAGMIHNSCVLLISL